MFWTCSIGLRLLKDLGLHQYEEFILIFNFRVTKIEVMKVAFHHD